MRGLWLVTAQANGEIALPVWASSFSYLDLFVLNPWRFQLESCRAQNVRETFVSEESNGLTADGNPRFVFRAYNEDLRRSFHRLLHWGRWDALVIDGISSVVPLIGDRGLEIPRELSWIIYRHERCRVEGFAESAFRKPFSRKRLLHSWHQELCEKAAEVVIDDRPRAHGNALSRSFQPRISS